MAEQQEAHSLASTFPNPPPFWKDFTPDRVARIEELRSAFSDARIPGLPDELTNLQPPCEPADGRWRVFGDQYMVRTFLLSLVDEEISDGGGGGGGGGEGVLDDKLPTLEDQGITNLPKTLSPVDSSLSTSSTTLAAAAAAAASSSGPDKDAKHYDRAFELKRLAKSLLLNFLELAGVLSRVPADAEAKIADLRTLFINVHHILNEYRPHQARESAIAIMQSHLDKTRGETSAIRTQVDKARRVLEGLGSLSLADEHLDGAALSPLEVDAQSQSVEERRDRAMSAAVDAQFGISTGF
ncbi:Mediator complex, subunit Med7 [Moelleriella libera RCEF 2490]|uniref:Mediator of RNA polymerase II transcription subunit 7 n=1 Tax=Moelleriella libera RCEF 2490 TaxID=1081109 RepID=A0A168D554_9HYPO|nr:Mediator complex, subunit Med7 [Moelleriella libera RCEF 2490]